MDIWQNIIKEIIFCTVGSVFFAVGMKVPKNCLSLTFLGSIITASIERLLNAYFGELIACCTAMMCLVFYCELITAEKVTDNSYFNAVNHSPAARQFNILHNALRNNIRQR